MLIGDERLCNRARICACVGLTSGASVGDVMRISGYSPNVVQLGLKVGSELGYLSRRRVKGAYVYHLTGEGRRYIESEVDKVRCEGLALIARARLCRWPRLALLNEMEEGLRR